MNITRNNYEEYFLLYVDNELSAAEKNMVEAFVAANTDLQEELVMLQQSIVKPNAVDFPGKENLLKQVAIDTATEEQLLMLLDNELGSKEKEQVLLSRKNNKAVQQEWELLKQTKLSPADIIIFEDKASLYRKEGSRAVPIKWWHVAAAAMLIGFGLWGAVSYFNKGTKSDPVTETATTTSPAGNNKDNTTVTPPAKDVNPSATDPVDTKNSTAKTTINNTSTVEEGFAKEKKQTIISPKQDKEENTMAVQQNDVNIPVRHSDNINNDDSNKKVLATVQPETQVYKTTGTNEIPAELKNSIAINTSLKDETGDKNSFTFDDDEEKPKKTKLGGFFKKVKRVLERNTKIKTGSEDEVRIANMSFAMH